MERTILLLGNPDLHQICEEVKQEGLEQMKSLERDLKDTLLGFRTRYGTGRAIAAPQIEVRRRVIYRHLDTEIPFVSPRLEFPDKEEMKVLDDCMSFPDLLIKVRRRRRCIIHYRGRRWGKCAMKLEEDISELLQHEYDYLDGILATMRTVDQRASVMKAH